MKHFLVVMIVIFLAGSFGCSSSNDLTRARAKDLVNKYFEAHPDKYFIWGGTVQHPITLSHDELEAGRTAGYWKVNSQGWIGNLSPAGTALFGPHGNFNIGNTFFLSEPRRAYVVYISGISDAPILDGPKGTVKIVDATWRYDLSELPQQITTMFESHKAQPFHALFKLYDDGWRVEKLVIVAEEVYEQ